VSRSVSDPEGSPVANHGRDKGANQARSSQKVFLASILSLRDELKLDDDQFNRLSGLYWDEGNEASASTTIASVASTLSSDQFARAVALALPEIMRNDKEDPAPSDFATEKAVDQVLEKRFKDKQLVELELATKIAERVMGWAKLFAFFLAAPVALGLLILSLFGISKFDDLQKASTVVDAKLVDAQKRVDTTLKVAEESFARAAGAIEAKVVTAQTKVDEAFKKAEEMSTRATNIASTAEQQLASVRSKLDDQNKQLGTLDQKVTDIAQTIGRRVALVIGNGSYANISPSLSGAKDARALTEVFVRLGFSTRSIYDADHETMLRSLSDFSNESRGAEVAAFFFSGHSFVFNGETFLLSIDANFTRAEEFKRSGINLSSVAAMVPSTAQYGLVLIDACYRGLAPFVGDGCALTIPQERNNLVISLSAQPGTSAMVGENGYSFYAQALLRSLQTPGLDLLALFNEVQLNVIQRTRNAQLPWFYSGLVRRPLVLYPAQGKKQSATPSSPEAISSTQPATRRRKRN
jgi:hypothetical protein